MIFCLRLKSSVHHAIFHKASSLITFSTVRVFRFISRGRPIIPTFLFPSVGLCQFRNGCQGRPFRLWFGQDANRRYERHGLSALFVGHHRPSQGRYAHSFQHGRQRMPKCHGPTGYQHLHTVSRLESRLSTQCLR